MVPPTELGCSNATMTFTLAGRRVFPGGADPLGPPARRAVLLSVGLVLLAACVGAGVRLLPWVLDPSIARGALAPFAKSLLAVAVEAALLTGWPVGWAVATQRLVDRGEARVLGVLGESPHQTVLRLAPQGLAFAIVLALTSLTLGRVAAAPGKVVNALLVEGRAACLAPGPRTHAVPFVSATWLCTPETPTIAGRAPVGGVVFSATSARASDDLRRMTLGDARLVLGGGDKPAVRVHVGELTLHGLSPWAQASAIDPAIRAAVVTASAAVAAMASVFLLLLRRARRYGGVRAAALGAAGPLGALALLRSLEVRLPDVGPDHLGVGWIAALLLVPVAALAATIACSFVLTALPERRRTGTK